MQVEENVVPSPISPCFVFHIVVMYMYTCASKKNPLSFFS